MQRRAFLSTLAAGATVGTAGCMGGDVVLSANEMVTVSPGRGEIYEIPASGDEIKYIARDDQAFDVYVFKSEDAIAMYRAFVDGEEPPEEPPGDRSLGGRALRIKPTLYELTTKNRGRESLDTDDRAYFVLDHSNYRGETPIGEQPEPLSVTLDLEVVASKLPL